MKNKIVITMLALTLAGAVAFAQGPRNPNGPKANMEERGSKGPGDRMADRLDLTPEQESAIEEIRLGYAKKNQPLENKLNELEARLQTLTATDTPDKKEIKSTVSKMSDLREEIFLNRTMCRVDVRTQLDDKQKLQFDQFGGERDHGKFRPRR